LEELLVDFKGTLFLVSHDRAFLNRVVTSTIVFEDNGQINEYVGGYDDWLRQKEETEEPPPVIEASKEKPKKERARKLTFKEKHVLEELPVKIDALETEISELHRKMANPDFYRTAGELVAESTARLEMLESELSETYSRWEELDALNN
ncbi:MAG: ABC transporter ATP-binding protein, partial [Desulfuromonadales bacterium]|nr:ABC transporter ATP-binding protein [Desulfuromonadales bacterium]